MPCVSMVNSAIGILAGGASSRMGQDKAQLQLPNEQTLLEFMLSKFDNHLVFSSGGKAHPNYPQIPDLFQKRLGPVAGIISSIQWLAKFHPNIKYCTFIPVDLAYLTIAELSFLPESEISYFKDNPLPLKINLSAITLEICSQIMQELQYLSGYPVYKFIRRFKSYDEIVCPNPHSLTNMNYISDWERFLDAY